MHEVALGGLAQLGEHLLCKQGVVGSIPSSSTKQGEDKGDDKTQATKKRNTKVALQKAILLLLRIT